MNYPCEEEIQVSQILGDPGKFLVQVIKHYTVEYNGEEAHRSFSSLFLVDGAGCSCRYHFHLNQVPRPCNHEKAVEDYLTDYDHYDEDMAILSRLPASHF